VSSETLLSEVASSLQSAVAELRGCREIVARAVATAQARAGAAGDEEPAVALTAVGIALGELAPEYEWTQLDLSQILEPIVERGGVELEHARALVFTIAVRERTLLALPPERVSAAYARLVHACAPVHEVACLTVSAERRDAIAMAGREIPSPAVLRAGQDALESRGLETGTGRGTIRAFYVGNRREGGVIVVRAQPRQAERAAAFATEAAAAWEASFEREAARRAAAASAVHDGPLQMLALLQGELALLRHQIENAPVADLPALLAGRLGDVATLASGLHDELAAVGKRSPPGGPGT
jgi:hypothetical protein